MMFLLIYNVDRLTDYRSSQSVLQRWERVTISIHKDITYNTFLNELSTHTCIPNETT